MVSLWKKTDVGHYRGSVLLYLSHIATGGKKLGEGLPEVELCLYDWPPGLQLQDITWGSVYGKNAGSF